MRFSKQYNSAVRAFVLSIIVGCLYVQPLRALEIKQFGITWNIEGNPTVGEYANGDRWVVGPVNVISISPKAYTRDGVTRHGSMVNPIPNSKQGLDSRLEHYENSSNVGLTLPHTLNAGSSLVSVISADSQTGNDPALRSAAVLTVVDKVQEPGSFRPPYCGAAKLQRWNARSIDMSKLRRLPKVPSARHPAMFAAMFERPWLEINSTWAGRYTHPSENQPAYGREIAHVLGEALLTLQMDFNDEEKRLLAVRMVQYGLDIYGSAENGAVWHNDGGHNLGRKLPMLFAGYLLNDPAILRMGDAKEKLIFQEDQQTWYVRHEDVGRIVLTTDGNARESYRSSDVGLPEWGEKHFTQPERDDRRWDAAYRPLVGSPMAGHVLAARLMHLENHWNWPVLFEYQDRYWEIYNHFTNLGPNGIQPLVRQMWHAYRGKERPSPPTGLKVSP